jgi:hypothetical protein
MLIYEHSISRKKHPSHEPCSHAKNMRHRVVGSCLSGLWVSNGCDPKRLPRPVTGGFMLGSETETNPDMGVKLTDRRDYCESSTDELTMEKNFGGA